MTGRFDIGLLRRTVAESEKLAREEGGHPPRDAEEARWRRALRIAKAEARAQYIEGRRLAMQRDIAACDASGASQLVGSTGLMLSQVDFEGQRKFNLLIQPIYNQG